jgi:hypothetical protein
MEMGPEQLEKLKSGRDRLLKSGTSAVYVQSIYKVDDVLYCIGRDAKERHFYQISASRVRSRFSGEAKYLQGLYCLEAPMTQRNMRALWKLFPFTQPVSLRDRRTTIGMGDRLGIATAGHLRAARKYNAAPVLAQQSVRELDLTGRTFEDVVADASFMVFQEGYEGGYGADGDHLKNIASIKRALNAGMPMITLDLTEVMKPEVADWDQRKVHEAFSKIKRDTQVRIRREYAGKSFRLGRDSVSISLEEAERCAVMYGPALDFAGKVDKFLKKKRGSEYDLEVSIDETTTPTLPAHHLFISKELQHRGVLVNSVAPRFIGEFQKAIDYIGNVREFDRQFAVHCEIARSSGDYKVSIHSGSDKFAVYPSIGRFTEKRVHLKTSGTSWLVALEVIARQNPALYRKIHEKALAFFPEAVKLYHVSVTPETIRPLEKARERDLPDYLSDPNSRQLLHITYGGILMDAELREELFATLHREEETYAQALEKHFDKHIQLLGIENV